MAFFGAFLLNRSTFEWRFRSIERGSVELKKSHSNASKNRVNMMDFILTGKILKNVVGAVVPSNFPSSNK